MKIKDRKKKRAAALMHAKRPPLGTPPPAQALWCGKDDYFIHNGRP